MKKKDIAGGVPAKTGSSVAASLEKMSGSKSRTFSELLLGQAIAANQGHHSAMKQMSKAANADLPEIREQWLRLSTKLMSLYARQLEALSKYQRKGGQNMTVRHVILGSVTHSRGGGVDE